jgi:anti-sigma regulatory factor (Ser/Thr protein kinase)
MRSTTSQELRLSPEPAAARAARALVRSAVPAARREDACLAVSEIVTNAVLHAREPIILRVLVNGTVVRVEVQDGSPVTPAISLLDPAGGVTGRGLVLVAAVTDAWGVEEVPDGKIVWFTIGDASREESDRLLASWADELTEDPALEKVRIVLTDMSVERLAASEAHSEGLLRELALLVDDPRAVALVQAAAPLDQLRFEIRRQVTGAMQEGVELLDVTLTVRREDAEQVRDFMHAMDEADRLSRQGDLLLVPTPPETSEFRRDVLTRLLNQLRS